LIETEASPVSVIVIMKPPLTFIHVSFFDIRATPSDLSIYIFPGAHHISKPVGRLSHGGGCLRGDG
jgi:hypothetical protein